MWTNGHTNFLSTLYVAETSLQLAWSEMVEDGVSDVVTSQSKASLAAAMQMFDQSRLKKNYNTAYYYNLHNFQKKCTGTNPTDILQIS